MHSHFRIVKKKLLDNLSHLIVSFSLVNLLVGSLQVIDTEEVHVIYWLLKLAIIVGIKNNEINIFT